MHTIRGTMGSHERIILARSAQRITETNSICIIIFRSNIHCLAKFDLVIECIEFIMMFDAESNLVSNPLRLCVRSTILRSMRFNGI